MTVPLLVFYLFSAVAVAAGVMVISARNPVHSVLFLILAFFNGAGLFVLIGAEFLAMVLVVVYVGAVAVLFLFVVMMLDINFVRLREGFLQYLPVGALIGLDPPGRADPGARHLGADAPPPRRRRRAADAAGGDQHRGSGRPVLHRLLLSVSGGRPDPPGRDDRRDHADPARAAAGAPPADRRRRCTAARKRRSICARCQPGSGI